MPVHLKEEPGVIKLVVREGYQYPIINNKGLDNAIERGLSSWVLQVLGKVWLDNSEVLYQLASIIQRDYPENEIDWENTFFIVEMTEYLELDVPDFEKMFETEKPEELGQKSESRKIFSLMFP